MAKYDKEPRAIMEFGYNLKLSLPLSVAQQIQTLLQHGTEITDTWVTGGKSFSSIGKYVPPTVGYFTEDKATYDTIMLSIKDAKEWRDTMDKALREDDEASQYNLIPPEQWVKLRSEK